MGSLISISKVIGTGILVHQTLVWSLFTYRHFLPATPEYIEFRRQSAANGQSQEEIDFLVTGFDLIIGQLLFFPRLHMMHSFEFMSYNVHI